jgi:Ca2+-transporting ATPase
MPDLSWGLKSVEVTARRAEFGANVLTPPPRTPGWKLYLQKFEDPVIRILMIAAGVAIAVGAVDGHVAEGVGILVAILLATFLAYWNESRAAREFDVLATTRDDVPVKVIRDGAFTTVSRRDIVVGDALFLETGEEIPADGLVVEAVGLLVNESRLSGESAAVAREITAKLHRGTTVVDGSAVIIVEAVGDRTEIGRTLVDSIVDTGQESPLKLQLAALSRIIGVVGFAAAAIAFLGLFVSAIASGVLQITVSETLFLAAITAALAAALINIWLPIVDDALELLGFKLRTPAWLSGRSWLASLLTGAALFILIASLAIVTGWMPASPREWIGLHDAKTLLRHFMIAVTIIVVAVPEGLAMSVTLSLAYSMRKMTASNTLVRKLDACETIGAATVICSDKTGTLTCNQMRVVELLVDNATNAEIEPGFTARIFEAIAVNTTAQLSMESGVPTPLGNPTEGALLLWAREMGCDYYALRERQRDGVQWGFNSERKFMATRIRSVDRGRTLHVKGAPEIVLARCTAIATASGERTMTDTDRDAIYRRLRDYQARGLRTLALAIRTDALLTDEIDDLAQGMTWLVLAAIADPVREDVPAAVAACRRAGIDIKIVTGDTSETAREIGRQIGLDAGLALTGPEFAALDDTTAQRRGRELAVLARARPADKLRLVQLLKAAGEVVAVTGDGVNDGPALNHANVGLAMGKSGTDVAREASDIILLDDSFPSIVNAVRWGRALYENIQRFILFQLTINVVALGLAVLGPLLGYELPLTVMQMLWVNLIMDTFAALALATEPPDESVLSRPPRSPSAFIVTPAMAWNIFLVGGLFLAIIAGLIVYYRMKGELTSDAGATRAGTIIFTVFVLLQFWNLFNAKAFGRARSVFATLGNNASFLVIAAAILAGQVLLVQFGGAVFRTVPLDVVDWLVLMASTSLVLVAGELRRLT